jgi:hypothetical protein
VRYARRPACFQHAETAGDSGGAAVRIADANDAALSFAQGTHAAREHYEHDQSQGGRQAEVTLQQKLGVLERLSDLPGIEIVRPPDRIMCQRQHSATALEEPQQGEHRQHDGNAQQGWLGALEEWLQAKPQIDPDAAMEPGDDQQRYLQHAIPAPSDPERIQLLSVAFLQAELRQCDSRREQMVHQQERDAKAKRELGHLGPRPAEMTPLVERPQPQAKMRRQRDVKRRGAQNPLPYPFLDQQSGFHHGDRDVAQTVVQQVGPDIGEERQTGDQSQSSDGEREAPKYSTVGHWTRALRRQRRCRDLAGFPPVHAGNSLVGSGSRIMNSSKGSV